MKMQKTALSMAALLGLCFVMAGTANAQEAQPGGRGQGRGQGRAQGGRQGGMMNPVGMAFKAIGPTAEQQTKYAELETKMREQMMGMRGAGGGDRQEMMQKMQEINKKFREDVVALLTPEQKPKFEKALEEVQRGGMMIQLAELNLTDDQKAKIEPIAKSTQEEMAKLRQDRDADPQARREKMTQLTDDFKAKVRPLLTPEQQKKLDTLRLNMGGGMGRRPGGGN